MKIMKKREILFRGKAINRNKFREYRTNYKNGDWVYGLISKPYCERFPDIPPEMTNTNGISGIDIDYMTIGQYTGLTDKNGVKIFEGDIISVRYECDADPAYGVPKRVWFEQFEVYFDTEHYCWYARHHIYKEDSYWLYEFAGECTIIGNIHDNPELINYVS